MNYHLTPQSFDSLASLWRDPRHNLDWSSVFILPCWQEAWWQEFGDSAEQYLYAIKGPESVIGVAPLLVRSNSAFFIGSADVCDYMDFVVAPGSERAFFTTLLDKLRQDGIRELHLDSLRGDSTVLRSLIHVAREQGSIVSCHQQDVSLDLDLPAIWEDYLGMLTPKQRREIQRKLRRLDEAGTVEYNTISTQEDVIATMDVFLKLLRESRKDKAAFMTDRMESFFRSIASVMSRAGLVQLGVLTVNRLPVAAVLCFDYNDTMYLYNSGYDPLHSYLSVGVLSKVLSIKNSIEESRSTYDFLKGAEEYKYHLGGREIPIYSCRITIT